MEPHKCNRLPHHPNTQVPQSAIHGPLLDKHILARKIQSPFYPLCCTWTPQFHTWPYVLVICNHRANKMPLYPLTYQRPRIYLRTTALSGNALPMAYPPRNTPLLRLKKESTKTCTHVFVTNPIQLGVHQFNGCLLYLFGIESQRRYFWCYD